MGKRKNGGYGPIEEMSNKALLSKLRYYALWYYKTEKSTSIALDILREFNLPRCHFEDDFESKKYYKRLLKEATDRGLIKNDENEENIQNPWKKTPISYRDVEDRIDTAYYMYVKEIGKNNYNWDDVLSIKREYDKAKVRARTRNYDEINKKNSV